MKWMIVIAAVLALGSPAPAQTQPAGEQANAATATQDTTSTSQPGALENQAAQTEAPAGATQAAAEQPDAAARQETEANQAVAPAAAADAARPPAAGGTTTAGTPGTAEGTGGMHPVVIVLIIAALFILPILAGGYLSRTWKMPDHGWKISLTLGVLAASIVVVTFGEFKLGPDLGGGITLIYEVADTGAEDVPIPALIAALKNRVDPTGTREVTIREYGSAIEIIIPETGPDALEYVKRRITALGQLEFRITLEPDRQETEIKNIIARAQLLPPGQKDVIINGEKVAEWVGYKVEEFGPVDQPDNRIVKRPAGGTPEALVLIDNWDVTGENLTSSIAAPDPRTGRPAVHFTFDTRGAGRFRQLTSENLPNLATNDYRYLGIILDKQLISAPSINDVISDQGIISGGAMTQDEVEYIVSVLDAGRLPAALNKTPISEQVISPTLGAVTVQKGEVAIVASMIAVVLFMIVYYRFAGIVAFLALSFNLLLVLALMVLIKAAFTLPGLAGLVLTIGMSVDANVLIYERIREELRAGAAMRMAIRNGFSRAMSAIIDSNITTIVSGIALYVFATDQVKGFAVTLILGILTSMFTAIFFARLVFDVAERRGWIKHLRMMKILESPNYNFLGARYWAIGASLVLIAIGLVATVARGGRMLDIDFTGGTSVTFTLNQAMSINEVRDLLIETELAEKNLLVVERSDDQEKYDDTRYAVDTSEQSVEEVKRIISESFGDKLMKYSVDVASVQPYSEGDVRGAQGVISMNTGSQYAEDEGISHDALLDWLQPILAESHPGVQPILTNDFYNAGSLARYKEWTVRLPGLDEAAASDVFGKLEQQMESEPLFPLANKIGGRVSNEMQVSAVNAIVISLLGMVAYLWFRFQKVSYGVAATVALVHDVLVTIGFLALSYYIVQAVPGLAAALQIESFQISLTIVAALLTIIGFSVNDTIVTFDRLREIKGKSPRLTSDMVNRAVNQTLGRTILTSTTVLMVIVILYFFGGEGIHSFAYSFLVGVLAGVFSTVFIAAPVLLWLSGTSASAEKGTGTSDLTKATPAMSR
jgi:SecD/SecF fusion protein